MMIVIDGRSIPIRPKLAAAIEHAWQSLRRPGTWWTGAERIAIAGEVRQAQGCDLCRRRKAALSPYTLDGSHDACHLLPPEAIEATHRIATDAGRLTERWVRAMCDGPLGEARYVELASIVAIVTALDTFDRALGRPARELPAHIDGQPSGRRPSYARRDLAWVATISPEAIPPGDLDPFAVHGDKNIHRALSLVPREVMNFFDLDVELYLEDGQIRDFANEHRAITHPQIELIAARASSINACFY